MKSNSSLWQNSNTVGLEYVQLFSTFVLFTHCFSTAFVIIVPQSYILSEYNKTHMALLLYAFGINREYLEGLSHEMNISNLFMLQSYNNEPLKKAKKYIKIKIHLLGDCPFKFKYFWDGGKNREVKW